MSRAMVILTVHLTRKQTVDSILDVKRSEKESEVA